MYFCLKHRDIWYNFQYSLRERISTLEQTNVSLRFGSMKSLLWSSQHLKVPIHFLLLNPKSSIKHNIIIVRSIFVYFFLILHLYFVALIWLSILSFSLHVINIPHKLNTPLKIIYGQYFWTWEVFLKHPKKRWVRCFLSMSLYSQYTSLWPVSNSPLNPVSQNGGTNNYLSSQFLRGSSSHYTSLSHSVTVPSSGSPMYNSSTATDVHDAAQYDTSPHGRLPSAWTPVTPPSLWWKCVCKIWERQPWNVFWRMFNLLWLNGRINTKLNLYNPRMFHI